MKDERTCPFNRFADFGTRSEVIGRSVASLTSLLFILSIGMEQDTIEQEAVNAAREYASSIREDHDALTADLYSVARGNTD